MFIKRISIQGFKTYKNTTVVDDLSPHLNVVVGRNGLGKSNFFSAIRFVLSDAYTHMTREERQGLIHEGSGTVMLAYVEIVFDNSDRRFPVQKDEVAIRRTIGMKKDDYSMDGRAATRSDIMNLLESAGFSRLNPYYIVPQGKITALTNSKDSERLLLLKEVSGAKLFEQKLRESTREMANSQFKMERVDESMNKLEEKIADLLVELDNLKEYQQLEKSKKVMEFNLFDRELRSLSTHVDECTEQYDTLVAASRHDLLGLEKREQKCQTIQAAVDDLASALKVAELDDQACAEDERRVLEVLAAKTAEEAALSSRVSSEKTMAGDDETKVAQITEKMHHNQRLLQEEYLPKLEAAKQKEASMAQEMGSLSDTQRQVLSKQSRFLQFALKKDRDTWLRLQIKALQADLNDRQKQVNRVEAELRGHEKQRAEYSARADELQAMLDDPATQTKLEALEQAVVEARDRVAVLTDQKSQALREDIRLRALRDSAQHELASASHKVAQTMDRSQAKALEAVGHITQRLNLHENVYGPLVELFSVPEKYKTAVEVVAGNALFHVVVDTDETALLVMKELTRTKAGRITIMPLNRIHPAPAHFPGHGDPRGGQNQDDQGHGDPDFIPLIRKIKPTHDHVAKALDQVFGKTIICSNLQRGSELAREHGLNAITLDGDRASTKGVLTGGFRRFKHARLDSLHTQARKRNEFSRISEELSQKENSLKALEEAVAAATRDLESKTRNLDTEKGQIEPVRLQLTKLRASNLALDREIATCKRMSETMAQTVAGISAKIHQFTQEKATAFTADLTPEESAQLSDISTRLPQLEQAYSDIVGEVALLETNVAELQDLNAKYAAQIKALREASLSDSLRGDQASLAALKSDISSLQGQLENVSSKAQQAKAQLAKTSADLDKKRQELEKANQQQAALVAKIEKASKNAEKILVKKAISEKRRDELQEKIRGLGALPEEAFQTAAFDNISLDEIFARLDSVHTQLKKYAHINKKAMEQHSTFAREREELVARKHELEESKESIERLVASLEQQKDRAIKNSFAEVSRSFSQVFEKLVPIGKGQLVMQTRDEEAGAENDETSIENYTGVSILVSFNSKEDEQQQIEQLSGGQKSLCAIALILAIQKCDPAPFYLFDEIDANLDTQYRTAVASMVKQLAGGAQFICTTFRPEMLQVAHNFYGVSFADKVSAIAAIEQQDALTFVETQR